MRKVLALAVVAALLFCGCHRGTHTSSGVAVVTRITVSHPDDPQQVYSRPDKLRAIMNRLRGFGQEFSPEIDPETLSTPAWHIVLSLSDGKETHYRVKPERYLQRNNAPWRQTEPKGIASLIFLLKVLPPDEGAQDSPLASG